MNQHEVDTLWSRVLAYIDAEMRAAVGPEMEAVA